jgi:hypothetical protein
MFKGYPGKQPFMSTKYPVKQPLVVKNCFGNNVYAPLVNPFEDLNEPMVQQQTIEQANVPKQNLPEARIPKAKGLIKFAGPDAPVYNTRNPPRSGPLLWWQKEPSLLDPETLWHRKYPLSPALGVESIDNSRRKEEPRKPSHGHSSPWYVESD